MKEFKVSMWACNVENFKKKMAHLNKILKKHGKEPFTCRFEDYHHKEVTFTEHVKGDAFKNDVDRKASVLFCTAVITGDVSVKKDDKDYRYIGSVRYEAGVKQSYCLDEKFESAFLNFREGICDHCGAKRMNRKSYFLFEAEGKVIQVGSTCVKEYLGIDTVEYLRCAENTFIVFSDGGDDDWFDGTPTFSDKFGVSYEQIYKFLDFATMGFMKWKKSSDGCDPSYATNIHDLCTVDIVRSLCDAYFKGGEVAEGNNHVQLTRDECLEYWKSQPLTTFTDNIINALSANGAHPRSLGTYCYSIYGAVNARVRASMQTVENTSKPCKFEVGKRVNIKGKIISIKSFEVEDNYSYRGGMITKYTVNFQDEDMALYHFNTGSATFSKVSEGDDVEIRGKVLESKEWKGVMYSGLDLPKLVHNFTKERENAA